MESAVASILDLQDPLDLEGRPSSSLSSVANETDRQETLGGSDTQGPSAPDVDSAVQGLLDEAPQFEEVADADVDEPVGVVDELCIHDDENVNEELVDVAPGEASALATANPERSQEFIETPLAASSPISFDSHHDHDETLLTPGDPVVSSLVTEDSSAIVTAAAATRDIGLLPTATVVIDSNVASQNQQQQPRVEDVNCAAHEAARRLSAEIRSVTGDVVESVATTSRLVEDAAGANRRSVEANANLSSNVVLLTPVEMANSGKPTRWSIVDTAAQSSLLTGNDERSPTPASARIGNVDDLKSSVNLSEESSSSESESDTDENDDDVERAGRLKEETRPMSVVKAPTSDIESELNPTTTAQPTEQLKNEPRVLDKPEASGDSLGSDGKQSSVSETARCLRQPDGQYDEREAEQDDSCSDTRSNDGPATLGYGSEKKIESNVAGTSSGTVFACSNTNISFVAGTSGELLGTESEQTSKSSKDQAASPYDGQLPSKKTSFSEQNDLCKHTAMRIEPEASPAIRRPDDGTPIVRDVNKNQSESSVGREGNVDNKDLYVATSETSDQEDLAALDSTDSQRNLEAHPFKIAFDQERQGGERPDSGSTESRQNTSPFKVQDDLAVSSQPNDTGNLPEKAGPSQSEETREAACYSEDNQSEVNKDMANAPTDKATPSECTTSGIRGSTTSSSLSEQSPSQDSPSGQQILSVEVSKPNFLVSYDLDSDNESDEEHHAAGPSEATAKDVSVTNPPTKLQSASNVEQQSVEDSAAGSSDDPVIATAANRISNNLPRHCGADVSSSLRAPFTSGSSSALDGCTESTAARYVDERALPAANKKSEVTSSSDQPTQDIGVTSRVSPRIGASCQPSAEVAVEEKSEPVKPVVNQDVEFSNRQQGHQADASSSDDKPALHDRLNESCHEEVNPEAFQDIDQMTQHHHAASSSSDTTPDKDPDNNASSTLVARTEQTSPNSDRDQPQLCCVLTGDEACSSSDKRMQPSSNLIQEEASDDLVEEASSSGDASHTEGQREATDVQSSTEACTEQQPVCRATSSDDIADENAAAESSVQGSGTPISSAASTPGAYVGSSSPPPASMASLQQGNQANSGQLHIDASTIETTGGASSSSDQRTTSGVIGESAGCSLLSSPSSNGSEQASKDETNSREARAIAEDISPGSEASATLDAGGSLRRFESGQQNQETLRQEEAQSGIAEKDEAESNRDFNVDASIIVAPRRGDRPDALDTTKSISSSEERTTVSGKSACQNTLLPSATPSDVTPSDAGHSQSVADIAAAIRQSEESGRGRCQSTSEQRPMPRTSSSPDHGGDNNDDSGGIGSHNASSEGSLPCSSSNSTGRPVNEIEASMVIDDDRDISSSNNANSKYISTEKENSGIASVGSEAENVSGSITGPEEAKASGSKRDSRGEFEDDDRDEAEFSRNYNKSDISSSQGISSGVASVDVNFAIDAISKVCALKFDRS